jgi:uncharacterized protein (TIGR00725 family)
VAVIGAGNCDGAVLERACTVGRLLAERGCVLVTGGLGGVMAAASRGAAQAGGLVIGVLPGPDPAEANPHVAIAIASGMGDARNAILANTAEAFVALAGEHGTLSEIAFALKRGKLVVSLGSWQVDPAILVAQTPEEAVRLALGE